ncbi:MAG: hypothetical protein ACXWC9_09750, partial [Pseudobdellovibrionaceae bacterium]
MIRVIAEDGLIRNFAGTGVGGLSAENGPAKSTQLLNPRSMDIDQEGTLYVADLGNRRIRKITTDGQMATIAGQLNSGDPNFSNSSVALITEVLPNALKVYRKRSLLYFQAAHQPFISMYHEALPDLDPNGYTIGSKDGSEIYQFSATGRHLRTLYAKTGKVKWTFTYDSRGRILQMRDSSGNITSIERDTNGAPVAMTGPFGHRISMTANSDGY